MALSTALSLASGFARTARAALALYPLAHAQAAAVAGMAFALLYRGPQRDAYDILWAVVFGFATLNILSLAAKHLEPARHGLSFGELMAVSVVLVSLFLLGWEMLNIFHVFPIKLRR